MHTSFFCLEWQTHIYKSLLKAGFYIKILLRPPRNSSSLLLARVPRFLFLWRILFVLPKPMHLLSYLSYWILRFKNLKLIHLCFFLQHPRVMGTFQALHACTLGFREFHETRISEHSEHFQRQWQRHTRRLPTEQPVSSHPCLKHTFWGTPGWQQSKGK